MTADKTTAKPADNFTPTLVHTEEWTWIHLWRIEVYRTKGKNSPLQDTYETRTFQDNAPLNIIEERIDFALAKDNLDRWGYSGPFPYTPGKPDTPFDPYCKTDFDRIQEHAIGYLLDEIKGKIRIIIKESGALHEDAPKDSQ
ncbi:MAG: hypothetical protein ACOCPQ_03880 [Desulfosudaceae bacterium]